MLGLNVLGRAVADTMALPALAQRLAAAAAGVTAAAGGSSVGGCSGSSSRGGGAMRAMASAAAAQPATATLDAAAAAAIATTLHLPLDAAGGDATVLLSPAQRVYASPVRLPDELARDAAAGGGAAPKRIAVLRSAFAPSDERQPDARGLVAPLGPGAVALAASTQLEPSRVLVDEYHLSGSRGGGYVLGRAATELATYLQRRALRVALVPDVSAAAAAAAEGRACNGAAGARRDAGLQSSNQVLMVAPTAFGFNEQAAQDNSFMHAAATPGASSPLTAAVCAEFAGLHRQLTEVAGVDVQLFQHALSHGTPDAVFPNNWFSTHAAGEARGGLREPTLVLYPMKCPNRAAERRPELVEFLRARGYARVLDLTPAERAGGQDNNAAAAYFEGTGVLVLDRVNGVAYVALSERADEGLARRWADELGYRELVTFRSQDARGKSVYHTNVMMAVGTGVAVVCAESVADAKERQHLLAKLARHHEVVQISSAQMDALCGNVLELRGGKGLPVMAMSSQAYHAFTAEQRAAMRRHVADLVHAPIDTLERVGGGGVRCALAELF